MKLYYSPGSCSLAPHIILRETRVPFELVKVDIGAHKTQSGTDYYAINSKGYVPLLELDNGERLSEGPVIAQYLSEQAQRQDLIPAAGTMARYRVLEWQNYITSELHKAFAPLFDPASDANAKATVVELLRKKLAWVSEQLAGKQYLTGETFTAADAYLFVVASWARYVNMDLSDLGNLQAFLQRVAARPAVQEALKAEGLVA